MKIIKEHINEKFTEESDPIEDMGIGVNSKLKEYLKNILNLNNINDINNYTFGEHLKGYDAVLCKIIHDKVKRYDIIHFLLASNLANPKSHHSLCLRWAAANGDINIMKMLIEFGANASDGDMGNSLDCAITYDERGAAKYLINLGVKPDTSLPIEIKNLFQNDPNFIEELKKQNII